MQLAEAASPALRTFATLGHLAFDISSQKQQAKSRANFKKTFSPYPHLILNNKYTFFKILLFF